jgi:hypothetical protein
MEDPSEKNTKRSWTRVLGWVAISTVLTAIGIVAAMVILGVSSSIRAEKNLHSTIFVIRLVEQFVAEERRWPRSWAELESVSFPSDAPRPGNGELSVIMIGGQHGYEWPAASKDLQSRVAIDFSADPAALARQDPMSFAAIKPIGPYYEYRDYGFVQSLQQTILQLKAEPGGEEAE